MDAQDVTHRFQKDLDGLVGLHFSFLSSLFSPQSLYPSQWPYTWVFVDIPYMDILGGVVVELISLIYVVCLLSESRTIRYLVVQVEGQLKPLPDQKLAEGQES